MGAGGGGIGRPSQPAVDILDEQLSCRKRAWVGNYIRAVEGLWREDMSARSDADRFILIVTAAGGERMYLTDTWRLYLPMERSSIWQSRPAGQLSGLASDSGESKLSFVSSWIRAAAVLVEKARAQQSRTGRLRGASE